jgi:hypothetical protein
MGFELSEDESIVREGGRGAGGNYQVVTAAPVADPGPKYSISQQSISSTRLLENTTAESESMNCREEPEDFMLITCM